MGATPDHDPDCESPRSFVSALSDLDRTAVKTGDWEARSPRRSSMEAVAEEGRMAQRGTQRLQLSTAVKVLLRQARSALVGALLSQPVVAAALHWRCTDLCTHAAP